MGDHVEILLGLWSIPVFGDVEEVLECDEGNMPCDLSNIQKIARKISKTEYEKSFTHSLIHAIAAVDTNNLISETPAIPFCAAQTAETFVIGTALWACVRGLSAEVLEVLAYLIQKDKQVYTDNDLILMETGISELYIYTEDVMDVMQKYDWEFLFLGANIDAVETARHFGIGADRAVNYHSDSAGTQLNYEVLSEAITTVRNSAPLSADWKSRIDEDYEKRGKGKKKYAE